MKYFLFIICITLCACTSVQESQQPEQTEKPCYDTKKYPKTEVDAFLKASKVSEEDFCDMSDGVKHLYIRLDASKIDYNNPWEKIHLLGLVAGLVSMEKLEALEHAHNITFQVMQKQETPQSTWDALKALERIRQSLAKQSAVSVEEIKMVVDEYNNITKDTWKQFSENKKDKNKKQQ